MIPMPWTDATAPNFILEITDACNVTCKCCYKTRGNSFKSPEQVETDLADGLSLRPAHTVTLSGGEPTLHPDLVEIIRLVKKRNLHVFLLTNGVLANANSMKIWKRAGLDSILFHLEPGQDRADLPKDADREALTQRLRELTLTAEQAGLDVSVSATLYENDADTLPWITRFVFDNPSIGFLFLSKATEIQRLPRIDGKDHSTDQLKTLDDLRAFFKQECGIEPFSCIPSTGQRTTCWISYFVPVAYRGVRMSLFRYTANRADLILMKLHRAVTGRFTHKLTQKRTLTAVRVLVNGLTSGRPIYALRFLFLFLFRAHHAGHKVIVYDDGPVIGPEGTVEHCEYCPTAVVRNGSLLACCTADRASTP